MEAYLIVCRRRFALRRVVPLPAGVWLGWLARRAPCPSRLAFGSRSAGPLRPPARRVQPNGALGQRVIGVRSGISRESMQTRIQIVADDDRDLA